eukprot:gene1162-1472_t
MSRVKVLIEGQLVTELAEAGTKLVVVDFTSKTCGPCHMIAPVFDQLSKEFTNVVFLKVDINECTMTASIYRIQAMPTFLFFIQNKVIDELVGADPNQLRSKIEKNQAKAPFQGTGQTLGSGGGSGKSSLLAEKPKGFQPDPKQLAELLDMGFPENRAIKGLFMTQNGLTKLPMDWIFENMDNPDIDDPVDLNSKPPTTSNPPTTQTTAPAATQTTPASNPTTTTSSSSSDTTTTTTTTSTTPSDPNQPPTVHNALCDLCGKQIIGLRFKCKTCPNFDLCEPCKNLGKHNPGHEYAVHDKDIENYQMTPEEKALQKKKLEERIQELRKKKAEDEDKREIERELSRRSNGKSSQEALEKWKLDQNKREADKIKREKEQEAIAKKRIKEKIEQDRLERIAKKNAATNPNAAPATTPAPAAVTPVAAVKAPVNYTESTIQIRLLSGESVRGTFPITATLEDVRQYVANNSNSPSNFTLSSTFPRKIYTKQELSSTTVSDAGLVPNVPTSADAESKALDILKEYSNITRYTYFTTDRKLTKYPYGLCGGTPIEDCDLPKYAEAVVWLSGVTIIIALVILVFSVIFWIFKACLLGGCRPTHGLFCPGPKYDPEIGEGYTGCQVWALRIAILFFTIGCVPLFIVSMTGNRQTTNHINELGTTVLDKVELTVVQLTNISTELQSPKYSDFQEYSGQIVEQLNSVITTAEDIQDKGQDVNKFAKEYNGYRNDIVLAGLIVAIVVCGVIAVSAVFSIPLFSLIGALALILVLPLMWIVFSAHYPANSLLSDACLFYNDTRDNPNTFQNVNPIINQLYQGCGNASLNSTIPAFNSVASLINDLFSNGYEQACNLFTDNLCQMEYPYWEHPEIPMSNTTRNVMQCPQGVTCSQNTLGQFLNSTINDFKWGCYIQGTGVVCNNQLSDCGGSPNYPITCDYQQVSSVFQCQSNCNNNILSNAASGIVTVYNSVMDLNNLWVSTIIPVIQCSNLQPFIDSVEDLVCIKAVNSLTLLIAPTGVFACVLVAIGICAVLGFKRFNTKMRVKRSISRESA